MCIWTVCALWCYGMGRLSIQRATGPFSLPIIPLKRRFSMFLFVGQLRQHCCWAWNGSGIWTNVFRCQIHRWVDDGVASQQGWNTSVEHRWCLLASWFNFWYKKTRTIQDFVLTMYGVGYGTCWLHSLFWTDQFDTYTLHHFTHYRWRFPDMFLASYRFVSRWLPWWISGLHSFTVSILISVDPFVFVYSPALPVAIKVISTLFPNVSWHA